MSISCVAGSRPAFFLRRFGTHCQPDVVVSQGQTPKAALKEHMWSMHFTEFGKGVSTFRSARDRELILKGVPDSFRAQVSLRGLVDWLVPLFHVDSLLFGGGCRSGCSTLEP